MNGLKLALRGVTRNKRRSLITISAIAVALMAIVVMNAFMDGNEKQFMDKVVEGSGHVQLYAPGYYDERRTLPTDIAIGDLTDAMETIRNVEGVTDAAAQITFGGLATFGGDEISGAFMGIEPEVAGRIHDLTDSVTEGRYLTRKDVDGCLVGYRMAELLNLELGDVLTVVTRTSYGAITAVDLTVVGIAATNNPMIDEGALLRLEDAQRHVELENAATAIIVNGEDSSESLELKENLLAALGTREGAAPPEPEESSEGGVESPTREGFEAYTWEELNYSLLNMIQVREQSMDIIRAIMIILAMAMIANTMLTNVFERTREIGVLMAMGSKGRQILGLFLTEAAVLGSFGSLVGVVFGTVLGLLLQNVGIDFGEDMTTLINIPMDTVFYALVKPVMVVRAFVLGIVVSVIAGLYPAVKAARMQPTKALRFI
jgi:putative ABC transport system permease protein